MKFPFLLALLFLLNGCGKYDIRNLDKPPPEDYETWKKPSNSQLDIKKALLECGAIAPSTLGWPYRKAYEKIGIVEQYEQFNHDFLVNRCMINAGFIEQNTSWPLKEACADVRYRDYPACQTHAIIPTPSVERRLNSWYCKTKIDYNYCLKYALAPQLCSPEKTKTPPPECLANDQNHPSDAKRINTLEADSSAKYADDHENNGLMRLWFPGLYHPHPMSPQSQEYMRRVLDQQRLQQNIQNQNNSQMNQLQMDTTPKARR